MYAYQFSKAIHASRYQHLSQFVTMQNHYNLIYREEEREMNPLCVSEGIGLIPWSPLARGVLAGNRKKGTDKLIDGTTSRSQSDPFTTKLYGNPNTIDNDYAIVNRVIELAQKKGVTAAQISLAWLLQKPNVVAPIVGTSKMEQLEEACEVISKNIVLTAEEMKYLEELYLPHAVTL